MDKHEDYKEVCIFKPTYQLITGLLIASYYGYKIKNVKPEVVNLHVSKLQLIS